MFVRTVEETYVSRRWNNQAIKHRDVFQCDECGNEFTLYHKTAHATNEALTFCGKSCNKLSRSSGKLAQQLKATNLKRYGVEFSSQVPGASEKMIASRIENTGAAAPSVVTSSSNAKFKATMLERHGAENPSSAPGVKQKKKRTYKERYGVDNPLSAGSQFRNRNDHVKGGQAGYRALIAKKGNTALSKPEAIMKQWLIERYGVNDVQQQFEIDHGGRKSWLIDFFIECIDVYIQVDGVFWHGLDRSYEQLHESKRDQFDGDRTQDEWFKSRNMKLVRITDKEVLRCQELGEWTFVLTRLEG